MRIDRLGSLPLFSTAGMTRIYSVAVIIQAFHAWDRGSTLLGFTFFGNFGHYASESLSFYLPRPPTTRTIDFRS